MNVEQALAASVGALDSARRVGWAKAFAERDRAESLSRDLNVAMDERRIMREKLSELHGFVSALMQGSSLQHAVLLELASIAGNGTHVVLDDVAVEHGRNRAARRIAGSRAERDSSIKAANTQQRATYNALVADARLAARYGFESPAEMESFLIASGRVSDPAADTSAPTARRRVGQYSEHRAAAGRDAVSIAAAADRAAAARYRECYGS